MNRLSWIVPRFCGSVLPGLIDVHTHLTFDPNFGYEALGISIPREALIGAKNARITLDAGFTTVRNVGAGAYTDVALRDAVNAGDVPGPRMLVSGPALGEALPPPEARERPRDPRLQNAYGIALQQQGKVGDQTLGTG